jgi:drug/metabolite transporter (DMT)-like permease
VRNADVLRFLALAAIWGSSYTFIRIASPVLGPLWTTEGRLLIGAGALLAWFHMAGSDLQWRHWRFYAFIGVLGTAIPFSLVAFAGMHLSASTMAIINTSAPMFTLALGGAFGIERITAARWLGLILGAAGVWVLTTPASGPQAESGPMFALAVAAILAAALAYALAALAVRQWGRGMPSRGMAVGTQLCAAMALLPLLPLWPATETPPPLVLGNLAALGLLGSGVAYVLYFRLVTDIGATRTQTVSLLIPIFGVLWGAMFLGESLTWRLLASGALIIAGTLLVMRTPRR